VIVWLDEAAMQTIRHETLRHPTLETGGALFGWRDADQCVIACAGDPGARARHRRRSFEANRGHSQSLINQIHEKSQGRYRFVGSWHSHPGTSRMPSKRDNTTAQEIAADPEVGLSEPLIVIISQDLATLQNEDPDQAIRCYWWSQLERRLIQSQLLNTQLLDKWC
jgi:integrative and conjugative element protein (TIGR02256 family)